jgi:uncharacterized membrane protein
MTVGLLVAFAIGFVAGLRSLTAPALVAWAAHLGWLNLGGTPISFMSSGVAVGIFSLLALGEFVADVLPNTPARTAPIGLMVRAITGGLCGACLSVARGGGVAAGIVAGIVGAMAGAYLGYYARRGLVSVLKVRDVLIAVPEDIVAVGLAFLIVR